jgi:hypothetical protein
MIESTEAQLLEMTSRPTVRMALFVYTPMCGTCKLARQMLNIIEQTYPRSLIYEANIQFIPQLRERWQLSSVPCLVRINDGVFYEPIYAFRSIPTLLELLEPWLIKE